MAKHSTKAKASARVQGGRSSKRIKRNDETGAIQINISAHAITKLWELPDVLIFNIVSFVAAPTNRAAVICHQLAIMCKESYSRLLEEGNATALWDSILTEDYGAASEHHSRKVRASKRLRQTPLHRVQNAHKLISDNTEIAFFYLTNLVTCNGGGSNMLADHSRSENKLSVQRMNQILHEFGPHLRVNKVLSSGGVFLVEVCRARHVRENVILKCVEVLIEQRGALVNLQTYESQRSKETALCVAAARGMPSIVKYLLLKGADATISCSGRFSLHTQPRKTLRCLNKTALEFAQAMKEAELEAGSTERDLSNLNKCIKMLAPPIR